MISPEVWEKLARFLLDRRSAILEQFAAIVRIDPKIQTADHLSKQEVVDHLPALLQSFAEQLRTTAAAGQVSHIVEDAVQHGRTRWKQGYRVDELLREFAQLRQIIMYQIAQFEAQHSFPTDERHNALRTLHNLLDEVMIVSACELTSQLVDAAKESAGN